MRHTVIISRNDHQSAHSIGVSRLNARPLSPSPATRGVFDRLLTAGLSIERIEQHLTAGRVRVDGELVIDPYAPAPHGAWIVLMTD